MRSALHILRDPCAYLALDYSIACSHLPSLITRVQTALERRDRGQGYSLPAVKDPAKWRAFEDGEPETHECREFEVLVRRTNRRLIVGKL